MFTVLVLTLIVASSYGRSLDEMIVGGREAEAHSWPWQVSLLWKNWHYCGGVLIGDSFTSTHVLTAAHCAEGSTSITMVLGQHDRNTRTKVELTLSSSDIKIHPGYDDDIPVPNDIALIKLPRAVPKTEYYSPVELPRLEDQEFTPENECYITGWGDTQGTGDNTKLRELKIPLKTQEECRSAWGENSILDTHICAGNGDKGACNGDSGGPLVCRCESCDDWVLAGVFSWMYWDCKTEGFPSVYIRVSKYINWIEANK